MTDGRSFWIVTILWAVPVAMAVAAPGNSASSSLALVAGILSAGAILVRPRVTMLVLPFLALLSPLGGFLPLPGASLLLSDLVFPLLAAQCAVLVIYRRVRISEGMTLPTMLGVCFLLSLVGGLVLGNLISVKPVLFVLQFAILFLYTREFAGDTDGWTVVIHAWIAAITLGALLMIHAFLSRTGLAGFEHDSIAKSSGGNPLFLFRATYYYAGFHFLLGIGIVIVLLRLLYRAPARERLVLIPTLLVLSSAMLMMLAKTAIVSVVVALVMVLALLLPSRPRATARAAVILAAWFGAVIALTLVAFFALLGDTQAQLWVSRLGGGDSFIARLNVYQTAFGSWVARPITVLVGLGPDFLGDSGAPELARSFMRSTTTGVQEGAVDSGWMTYLLEFGVVGFAVLCGVFVESIRRLRAAIPSSRGSADLGPSIATLAALIFLVVSLMTQALGYSKTSWFPFQLLVIGLMHPRPKRPNGSSDGGGGPAR